jgi:thymidylate synthase (FAD)
MDTNFKQTTILKNGDQMALSFDTLLNLSKDLNKIQGSIKTVTELTEQFSSNYNSLQATEIETLQSQIEPLLQKKADLDYVKKLLRNKLSPASIDDLISKIQNRKEITGDFTLTEFERTQLKAFVESDPHPKIEVDRDGFVELWDWMGEDLSVVNAARVSYAKYSDDFCERDEKLMTYLWQNNHTSPFRHAYITFKVRCPIFVLRQWQKHIVGCGWTFDLNEQSARYTVLKEGNFHPSKWRLQDTKNKQSSVGELPLAHSERADELLHTLTDFSKYVYSELEDLGVCKEQCRFANLSTVYTESIWTCSLQALMHFLLLRTTPHAQEETRLYAKAVGRLVKEKFPKSISLIEKLINIDEDEDGAH